MQVSGLLAGKLQIPMNVKIFDYFELKKQNIVKRGQECTISYDQHIIRVRVRVREKV